MDTKPETAASPPATSSDRPVRVIKRYSNRKLYDTKDSRYVTLLQIAGDGARGRRSPDHRQQHEGRPHRGHPRADHLRGAEGALAQRSPADAEGAHSRADREGPRRPARGAHRAPHPGRASPRTRRRSIEIAGADEGSRSRPWSTRPRRSSRRCSISSTSGSRPSSRTFRPFQQMQQEVRRLNERVEELERKLKGDRPTDPG